MTVRFDWLSLPRPATALLAAGAIACAAAIGLMPERATLVLGGLAALGALLLFIRHPLVGVGLCLTLVLSGGISQLVEGSVFQRAYSLVFVLTIAAYGHHLLGNRALMSEWLRIRPADVLFALLLLIAILSWGVADRPEVSVGRISQLAKGVALYFLVSRAIRTRTDLIFVGRFLLVGGIVQAVSAYTDSAFTATDGNQVLRVSGNLKDANAFAGALLPVVPWALYFFAFGRTPLWRTLGAVGLVLLPITLLSTISRSALVVLVCLGLFWPMFSTRKPSTRVALMLVSTLVLTFAISLYWESFLTRWRSLDEWLSNDRVIYVVDDDGGRAELQAAAWQIAREHPWLGMGIGNGAYAVGREQGKPGQFYAHNMYANVAVDMGFLGLGVFLALIAAAYWGPLIRLLSLPRNQDRAICATVITMLTCWTLFGLTLNTEYQNYAYGMLALCFVVPALVDQPAPGRELVRAGGTRVAP